MAGVLARLLFYPTLAYNVVIEKVSSRRWFDRVDETVLLGALPFRSMTKQLVETENVRGVITMNENYETKHFCNSAEQDLAPAHTPRRTKTWFDAHAITVLDWPANSPDLNPIENRWGIIKRKMRGTRPKNKEELTASIMEIWASITPSQCHRLIASMPRHIGAVIKAKGFPTKY
ncbi:phosphatidylglycerophosphatase and protein-tyrosine phosphatase 1 isoform X2 [Phycodurus eques]|uniref:phosphatidylglycerophosphatase and protein-tyrosine phosphatase 1 isoform X2 n=1 Tax=Phycodurus eques TaxID=693459 RepID=UPI002ACE571A|nr:phosphatidylglycerophosphatase and protein-tyrosine phosphatase 1 isoform X2 [Phycodurus eques]